jgi:predicted nucleic acid-binding protein
VSRFVIDASVEIKWFIPEVHSAAAQRLLSGNHELLIPDLFFPEVAKHQFCLDFRLLLNG